MNPIDIYLPFQRKRWFIEANISVVSFSHAVVLEENQDRIHEYILECPLMWLSYMWKAYTWFKAWIKKDPDFESSQSKPLDSDSLGGLWLHPSQLPRPENVKVLNQRKKENKQKLKKKKVFFSSFCWIEFLFSGQL